KRSIAEAAHEKSPPEAVDRNRLRESGREASAEQPDPAAGSAESDARVWVSITSDGLEARIKDYQPPQGEGRPLAVADLEEALRKAGVVAKPDAEQLKRVADRLAESSEGAPDLVLARGRPPEEPMDATVEPIGDVSNPVVQGAQFARRIPPRPGMPGRGVDGREIPPKSTGKPKDLDLVSEANCRLDERQNVIVSDIYGKPHILDGKVWVEPLLTISGDQIEVLADIHPVDHEGRPIEAEAIHSELARMHVTVPAQKNTISSALNRAQKGNKPQLGILAAKGVRPENGKDGWLEILVKGRVDKASMRDDGRVDHRDKGVYPSVEAGVDIARLHPPSMGLPGADVFGKPIPAKRGQAIKVAAGENVEILEDGKLFRSKDAGIVVHRGGTISVTECLEIRGDVDYSTGNLTVDRGSIKVSGSLLAGFSITAPEHVMIGEVVESARITAGKDVDVRGGIIMPDGGLVKAGGRVACQFANNANVEAGGDVVIAHNISNCHIQSRGRVLNSKGKGIIQGGLIVCGQGLDTNETGSELGVTTTIMVSVIGDESRELLAERKSMVEQVEKINSAVGAEDPKTCLLRTPENKRKAVAELLKVRIGAQQRIKEIDKTMAEREQQHLKQLGSVRIQVRRVAWPGTIIKIGGRTHKVKTETKACRFYWEKETQEIVVGNLR
ncbi:MAG: flagellar assembly protein A, partial [Desulfovibrionaceae bacterium]